MPRFWPLRRLVPLLLAATLLPVAAKAGPSLAEAIREADSKYLQAKELETRYAEDRGRQRRRGDRA